MIPSPERPIAPPVEAHPDESEEALRRVRSAPPPPRRAVALAGLAAALGVLALLGLGAWHRSARARAAAENGEGGEAPRVRVARPRPAPAAEEVELPGSVTAIQETPVYARTSGYVARFLADIGDRVRAGQPLALLETPDLDQELAQAEAALAQAEAALQLARARRDYSRVTRDRFDALAGTGIVSRQDADDRDVQSNVDAASVRVGEATLRAQRASLARLRALKSFARVTAPFDGVITARVIDVGTLVTAGNGAGQVLFRIARTDVLRVFVNVPQPFAPGLRPGMAAKVTVREFPGRAFAGTVARTAGALDAASRTLLTEVHVPNRDGALLAGMYARVALPAPRARAALLLPATALRVDRHGPQVAVAGPDGRVRLRRVVLDDDLGQEIAVGEGLVPADRVVVPFSDRLHDGDRVEVEPLPESVSR